MLSGLGAFWLALAAPAVLAEEPAPTPRRCPGEMVEVRGFCIDRFESSMVDAGSGAALSPYYPVSKSELEGVFDYWQLEARSVGDAAARALPLPELPLLQRERTFTPRA